MLITWRDNHYLGLGIFLPNLFPNHIYLLISVTLVLSVTDKIDKYIYVYLLNNGTYHKISVGFFYFG